jgi:hypothetical protein
MLQAGFNGISAKKPIILVPGFGGSKLVDTCPIRNTSKKKTDISLHPKNEFINLNIFDKEWKDRLALKYDTISGASIDDNIDVYDFGGVEGIRNLCEDCDAIDSVFNYWLKTKVISSVYNYRYFDAMICRLENLGYRIYHDLYGVPYDFRKVMIPTYRKYLFAKLKELIEESYEKTSEKNIIVAHSLGCLVFYSFLVEFVDGQWKDKYIDTFISVGGPYGGCSIALKTMLSGLPRLGFLKEKYLDIMRTSTGLALALPNHLGYDLNDIVVMEGSKGYGVYGYLDLMPEMGSIIWEQNIKDHIPVFKENTGVKTVMVVSLDNKTDFTYNYKWDEKQGMYLEPTVACSSAGDGMIGDKSLLYHYLSAEEYPNYITFEFKGTEHTKILETDALSDLILSYA